MTSSQQLATTKLAPWQLSVLSVVSSVRTVFQQDIRPPRIRCMYISASNTALAVQGYKSLNFSSSLQVFNTLRPGDTHICVSELGHHWFRWWPVWPTHYLNQWWFIVNWKLGNKLQWNANQIRRISLKKLHLKMPFPERLNGDTDCI